MSRYAKWAQREHSEARRIAITLLAGPVFLGLLPFLVAGVGPRLDRRLGLPSLRIGRVHRALGGLLMVLGFSLGFWSVFTQLTRGRGTPLPVMPTQELLTEGPFRYCRNPMTLGTILAYLGIGVGAGTIAGTVLVLGLSGSCWSTSSASRRGSWPSGSARPTWCTGERCPSSSPGLRSGGDRQCRPTSRIEPLRSDRGDESDQATQLVRQTLDLVTERVHVFRMPDS